VDEHLTVNQRASGSSPEEGAVQIGLESDRWIRHAIQDRFAHNLKFPDTRQPGFESLSDIIQPYYQIQHTLQTNQMKTFSRHE
jgi:hypothetical protein